MYLNSSWYKGWLPSDIQYVSASYSSKLLCGLASDDKKRFPSREIAESREQIRVLVAELRLSGRWSHPEYRGLEYSTASPPGYTHISALYRPSHRDHGGNQPQPPGSWEGRDRAVWGDHGPAGVQEEGLEEMNGKRLTLRNIAPSDVHTLRFLQGVANL